jgi:methionine-rich copper-binding protein CopC
MKVRAIALCGAIFLLTSMAVASAHTTLVGSKPSKGALLKIAPTSITLKFDDPLLTLSGHLINKIALTDPSMKVVALNKTKVHGSVVEAQISTPLSKPGKYMVSYRVAAQDGHIVTGSFSFTLRN